MLRHIGQLVLLFVILCSRLVLAAAPEQAGLHLSFQERLALSYALLAQGESSETKQAILARAKQYFSAVYEAPVQTVPVKNFSEFLRLHKGAWPDTHSLALDLQIVEARGPEALKVYQAPSERVQKQIDSYLEWQQEEFKKMIPEEHRQGLQVEDVMAKAMVLAQDPQGQKMAEDWMLSQSEALLAEKMKELDKVGERIADSKLAQQQDPTMRIFLKTMFSEYFSRLSPASKKLIVSSYLGGDLNIGEIKKFELMVQNSGPQLQKLLQVVARQADLGPEMLEIFRSLENSVRPVPWVQVEDLLSREKGNFEFLYFERKPLGVGTMAQVHRAKVKIQGQRHDVVVRFIKPGIADRVEEDRKILTEVAGILDSNPEFRKTGAPKLTPIIQDITDTVIAELSQRDTIERQKLAATRYEKTAFLDSRGYKNEIQFHVPRIYEGRKDSQFMVQEMVFGKKLDKEVNLYKDIAPEMKRILIEEMARVWAREVMFGGGFYHSDLHQGNFMVQVTDRRITVNILDYGMGGVISKEMQRQVMVLGAGTELLNADLIARGFWKLSEKSQNTLTEAQFRSMVQAKVAHIRSGREEGLTLERWTAWAMDLGIKLPYEFVSLNRGLVIVNKLLADSGSTLTVTSLMKSMARSHPVQVYKALVIEEKISHKDLIKLGWAEMKDIMGLSQKVLSPVSGGIRCEMVFQ